MDRAPPGTPGIGGPLARATRALLCVVGAGAQACSAPPPPVVLTETHILAARDSHVPDSFVRSGQANAVWRRVGTGRVPVLESNASFSVAVPVRGGGRLAVRAVAGADTDWATMGTARFEVSLVCTGAAPRALTTVTLPGAGPRRAPLVAEDLPLPESPCDVSVSVVVQPAPFPGTVFLADPVVERHWTVAGPGGPRANLLLISADTTRADALGPWGGPPTPHLDRLAAQGVVFEDAHSVAFGTTPSHASLFTGQPAARHGVYDNHTTLAPGMETLAERLRDAGYQTAAFVGGAPVTHRLGLDQGFLLYDDVFAPDDASALGENALHERRADVTVDRFGAWLDRRPAATPFAAWLHFYDPHQPYSPRTVVAGEAPEMTRLFGPPGAPVYVRPGPDLGGDLELVDTAARRRYEAEIAFVDAELGRAIGHLESHSVLEDTLIVFVTDHGESFVDRGVSLAWAHNGLLPEVTHIGALLRLPHGELRGRRVSGPVANSDLACLVARVLGVEPADTWSCRDLLPGVRAGGLPPRELVLEGAHRREVAVRSERWLLREAGPDVLEEELRLAGFEAGARLQMYDLGHDADARHDLVAVGEAPASEQARLRQRVAEARRARVAPDGGRVLDDEAHREGLRALGYVH